MQTEKQKIDSICGNCIYIQDWLKTTPPGCEFCGHFQKVVSPYQNPCSFYSGWKNPKYAKENN